MSFLRQLSGAFLVGLGVLGLILPLIPGLPLLAAGAALLKIEVPYLSGCNARIAQWWKKKNNKEKKHDLLPL